MRVYLSGPMTGLPGLNVQAFDDAERALRGDGNDVYNPCDHLRWPYEDAMTSDINMLTCCLPDMRNGLSTERLFDAMVLLPGWDESRGARLERDVAEACGIRVMTLDEAIGGDAS